MTPRFRAPFFSGAALALLLLFTLAGCDNGSSGTTPTAPSGTLQVTAARTILRAGETLPLAVTSAGAPATSVTWASTDTSVLAVSATGVATAGRPGRVTVTAASGSASGSLALRVVPDYNGSWGGGLARLQVTCSATSTAPICVPGAATGGTITLRVMQIGDQLTGTLTDSAEPTAPVTLTGQVLDDDQLSLAGRAEVPAAAPTLRVDANPLRASFDAALGTITGSYTLVVQRARTGAALQEDYRAQVQFRDLRRQ